MTTIYHNPRCSKSRQTLALLHDKQVDPKVVEYLKSPPTSGELKQILKLLGITPRALLRSKEPEYQALGLDDPTLSDDAIIEAMVNTPKLMERPIVIHAGKAAIGRPPELVLKLF